MAHQMPPALSSDEVNFLVYRYLAESGYAHAAFVFAHESFVIRSNVDGANVPPGALVAFLQKGLQYLDIEAQVFARQGTPVARSASLIDRCVAGLAPGAAIGLDPACDEPTPFSPGSAGILTGFGELPRPGAAPDGHPTPASYVYPPALPASACTVLEAHLGEIIQAVWSPAGHTVATSSADDTVCVWTLPERPSGPLVRQMLGEPLTLDHAPRRGPLARGAATRPAPVIMYVHWHPRGEALAIATVRGEVYVWNRDGALRHVLHRHVKPVFAVQWNTDGTRLASCGTQTTHVWDAGTASCERTYHAHRDPTLDLDWRDSMTFATCGIDGRIVVYRCTDAEPMHVWDAGKRLFMLEWGGPARDLVAAAGEGSAVHVWSLARKSRVHTFTHPAAIQVIAWGTRTRTHVSQDAAAAAGLHASEDASAADGAQTGGLQADGAGLTHVLATSCADHVVRVWDAVTGRVVLAFRNHRAAVNAIAFSPCRTYLATASADRECHVYALEDGRLVRRYVGRSPVNHLSWDPSSARIVVGLADHRVIVFDIHDATDALAASAPGQPAAKSGASTHAKAELPQPKLGGI